MYNQYTGVDDIACVDPAGSPMEDQLKYLGILGHMDNSTAKSMKTSSLLKDIDLKSIILPKKVDIVVIIIYVPEDI